MSILKIIAEYDQKTEEYIAWLKGENKRLESKISEMIDQGMRDAQASEKALFEGIISGAISKPRDNKVWIAFKGEEVGGSDVTGIFYSEQDARVHGRGDPGWSYLIAGPFEIK